MDTYRDAVAQRVVASYPPLYRPPHQVRDRLSENGGELPRLLRNPWGRRPTPSGARPSPYRPTRSAVRGAVKRRHAMVSVIDGFLPTAGASRRR